MSFQKINPRREPKSPYTNLSPEEIHKETQNIIKAAAYRKPRPTSTRPADSKLKSKKQARPNSAVKPRPRSKCGVKMSGNRSFGGKLKKAPGDKVLIQEENLQLRSKLSQLSDENTRLNKRVSQLERELEKRDNVLMAMKTSPSISSRKQLKNANVKQVVKGLRNEIKVKDSELSRLKGGFKASKVKEMEIELQAYIDECTRLRHYLEEILSQQEGVLIDPRIADLEKPVAPESSKGGRSPGRKSEKRKKKGADEVDTLKAEVQQLRISLKKNLDSMGNKEREFRHELSKQQREIQAKDNLIQELQHKIRSTSASPHEKLQQDLSQKSFDAPPELLKIIHSLLLASDMKLEDFIKSLDPRGLGVVEIEELNKALAKFNINMKRSVFLSNMEEIFGKTSGRIQLKVLQNACSDFIKSEEQGKESIISLHPHSISMESVVVNEDAKEIPQGVKDMCKHICLRLQLYRVEKEQIQQVLFGGVDKRQEVDVEDLIQLFRSPPLSLEDAGDLHDFAEFLCDGAAAPLQDVIECLQTHLEDWKAFSNSNESQFDQQIAAAISEHRDDLIAECRKLDSQGTGRVKISEFRGIMSILGVDFAPEVWNYMKLLFYSHKYELDRVPYLHFIDAYGSLSPKEISSTQQSSRSLDEEQQARIVRHYLEQIAEGLTKAKLQPADIFETDGKGLIYPDNFVKGLERLGMNLEHEHILIMLEGLQYEEEEDIICVQLKEFEYILGHYGKGKQDVELSDSDEVPILNDISKKPGSGGRNFDFDFNELAGEAEGLNRFHPKLPDKNAFLTSEGASDSYEGSSYQEGEFRISSNESFDSYEFRERTLQTP